MCSNAPFRGFFAATMSAVCAAVATGGTPSTTAFTYQGQLKQAGLPATDTCDFAFSLWDGDNDPDPGTQIESTIPLTAAIVNGLFQVELDFGSVAFNGDARWLQIDVCCSSPCAPAFVSLTPRQRLTATPYAVHTRGLFVDDAENVSVGTDSPDTGPNPTTKLHLEGAGYPGAFFTLNGNGGDFDTGMHFRNDGVLKWHIYNRGTDDSFNLRNSSFQPMLFATQQGNVGIGTGSPSSETTLHVSAGVDNFGILVDSLGATGSEIGLHSGQLGYASLAKNTFFAPGWKRFDDTKGAFLQEVDPAGNVRFNVAGAGADFINWNEALTLRAGGDVQINGSLGVGTASPATRLHVIGNATVSNDVLVGRNVTADANVTAGLDVVAIGDVRASGVVRSGGLISLDGTFATGKIRALSNLEIMVSDKRGLWIAADSTSPNLIGGSEANNHVVGVFGATIGGGGSQGAEWNLVLDSFGTIGGGSSNAAGDSDPQSDPATATHATVGGGWSNAASASNATVGGGKLNQAQGANATVAGGANNAATGESSAVPGGDGNAANGDFSFAAGKGATADHAGSFVWSDSLSDVASTGDNQFIISADGGVGIGLNNPTHQLSVAGSADFSGFVGIGDLTPDARLDVERRFSLISPNGSVAVFNRTGADGHIVDFQQDGRVEGWISVSGSLVTYSGFTGSHLAWTDEQIETGMLVSMTGENRRLHDNPQSEIIYGITRSSAPNDSRCLGAYLSQEATAADGTESNRHLVMAVGNGDMCVTGTDGEIQPGDYLVSSSVPGCAMKYSPDNHGLGHVVARAAERVRWKNVQPTATGVKKKKISVLFENFVLSLSSAELARTVVAQRQELEHQREQISALSARLDLVEAVAAVKVAINQGDIR